MAIYDEPLVAYDSEVDEVRAKIDTMRKALTDKQMSLSTQLEGTERKAQELKDALTVVNSALAGLNESKPSRITFTDVTTVPTYSPTTSGS